MPEPALVGIEPDKRWRFEADRIPPRVRALLDEHAAEGAGTIIRSSSAKASSKSAAPSPSSVASRASRSPPPTMVARVATRPIAKSGTRPLVTGSMAAPLLLIPAD